MSHLYPITANPRRRMRADAEAALRRQKHTGADPWVELAPGIEISGVQRGRRRFALAQDILQWLSEGK